MSIHQLLGLVFLVSVSTASPLPGPPTQVLRRDDPPAPSAYPLGDACGNEWQYLNFDATADATHLGQLHDVICSGELRAISSWGAGAASDVNTVYQRYFPENDPDDSDDETEQNVEEVLMKIAGQSSTEGMIGEIVASFIVDNTDFGEMCSDGITLAYTQVDAAEDGGDDREKIHFCDIAYDTPTMQVRTTQCNTFDPYASTKIDTFSRIVLHEMMHYSTVGADGPGQIGDTVNTDGLPAYEPRRAHALVAENPALCENNADNYAWMSVEMWLGMSCTQSADPATGRPNDQYFTQDPPPYTAGEPGDGDE